MHWKQAIVTALALLLLGVTSCFEPDIGDTPFLCASEGDQCPKLYHCVEGICRPEHHGDELPVDGGSDAPDTDGPTGDDASGGDAENNDATDGNDGAG